MPWYDKKWVIWLAIIIFPPIGLLLMFRSPNFSTKAKGIVTAVILLILVIGHTSKDKNTPIVAKNNSAPKIEQAEPKNYYNNGQFKVGVDFPAGEYIAVGTGYVEVSKLSSGGVDNILINDNIENARRYVIANDGEYVKVTGDIKLYPLADAPKIDTSGQLAAGEYKVGTDIKSGEYKITLDAGGYYAVTNDTRRDIAKNQFTNEGGSYYATVSDGQYLQVKKGVSEYVGATKIAEKPAPAPQPIPKPAPPPKPAKVLNLGMTFEQFKAAYNGKINEIAPETGWNISTAQLKSGDVQDVFTVTFNENVVMLGIVDKASRAVKEILITATPKSETDGETALLSYGLVLATLNPELNAERRWEVFDALKLTDGKVSDLMNGDGKILLGNIRYQTKFDKSLAMFYLTASAKDL